MTESRDSFDCGCPGKCPVGAHPPASYPVPLVVELDPTDLLLYGADVALRRGFMRALVAETRETGDG